MKHPLASALLLLASCVFTFLVAEVFVRIFDPYARETSSGGIFVLNNDLGWELEPRTRSQHFSRYFAVEYVINTLGFRDAPRTVAKPTETYRILLYGDSQIFGWGIPPTERFSNLVEQQQPQLEVWNLGVPGYGLDQELLAYEKAGADFNADAVMFYISQATLTRTQHAFMNNKYKPQFVLAADGRLQLRPLPRFKHLMLGVFHKLLSPLYLPYFIQRRLAILRGEAQELTLPDGYVGTSQDAAPQTSVGQLAKAILLRARATAQEHRHEMLVLSALAPNFRRDLQAFCQKNDLPLLEIRLAASQDLLIFGNTDPHWTPHSHRLIAQQLSDHLRGHLKK